MTNKMLELGLKHSTDKVTHHKYHEVFPIYIEKFYNQKGGIIEIGIEPEWGRASLNMWLELFPNMHIYGIDIKIPNESSERYTLLQCDQSNEVQLDEFTNQIKHKIYFINDDGSHIPEHQLLTFNKLFPLLEVGGVYIIEDIEVSYWNDTGGIYGYKTQYGKDNRRSIIEIFKKAINGVNAEFSRQTRGQVKHQKEIASICFHKNCIVITKKQKEELKEYRFKENL